MSGAPDSIKVWIAQLADRMGIVVHARAFASKSSALRWLMFLQPAEDEYTASVAAYWTMHSPALDPSKEHEISASQLDRA